ncbi:MAG: potassium transporter TrkG [Myxococcota bacterium]
MDTERRALRAVLLALAPAAAALGTIGPIGVAVVAALASGAALLGAQPRLGRMVATLGVSLAALGWITHHLDRPGAALIMLLWAGGVLTRVWPTASIVPATPCASAARWVTLTLSIGWLLGRGVDLFELGLFTLSAMLPAAFSAPGPTAIAALLIPAIVFTPQWLGFDPAPGPIPLLLGPLLLVRDEEQSARLRWLLSFWISDQSRLLVTSFFALCGVGTVLLSLPFADAGGEGHALIDAAFTAVSAACVTGLAVLDTANDFSLFGLLVLAGLIQVGGLGIMTFAAAALLGSGGRLTLREEAAASDLLGASARADLPGALLRVFSVTLITEFVGALLLTPLFWLDGDRPLAAAWRAIFTSVSAFCNAGFALQRDSLTGYADAPLVMSIISGVIIVGGLGPAATVGIPQWIRGGRVSLTVRIVAIASLVLTVVPALMYLALEWSNTLAGMTPSQRLLNAVFQSVTLRTAGFNSVDLTAVSSATLIVMIVVMFIGGSPGSTAGGVKTTTIAVLLMGVFSTIRGQSVVQAFGRRIPQRTLNRANAIVAVATIGSIGATLAILVTQPLPLPVALFEVVSALATVGLSVGGTAELDSVGKVIIIGCMFTGRVGPITLFLFLTQSRSAAPLHYPEEEVAIG